MTMQPGVPLISQLDAHRDAVGERQFDLVE
jgi:hypothetical protein